MELTVQSAIAGELPELRAEWMELERRAEPNFFLSWHWIGPWISVLDQPLLRLRGTQHGKVVLLAILVQVRSRRHRLMPVNQLRLHESGRAELDAITIENNGFLLDRSISESEVSTMFDTLRQLMRTNGWDELALSGVPNSYAEAAERVGLAVELDQSKSRYEVNLSWLRDGHLAWLETLSPNTRRQIRKAFALAGAVGELKLEAAADTEEALNFFDQLRVLHESRWRSRGRQGAFAHDTIVQFHREVISRGVPEGAVELLRISAGREPIGFLYNFTYGRRVSNYQGGFRYLRDNRYKPGLVAHAMCIERALGQGYDVYDLLAGEARYKASIGRKTGELSWCRAQGPNLILSLERAARRLKQTLSRQVPS